MCPVSTDLGQSLPSYSQLFNSKLCARGHAVNPMLYDCYSNIDFTAFHLSSKLRTPIFFFAKGLLAKNFQHQSEVLKIMRLLLIKLIMVFYFLMHLGSLIPCSFYFPTLGKVKKYHLAITKPFFCSY